jgi:CheY-like chemotaxis protein
LLGYSQRPEDRQRAAAAGFDAHLVKPVDFDALTKLLIRD